MQGRFSECFFILFPQFIVFCWVSFGVSDLTKHVLKEHSKAFPKILEKAREVLRDVS